MPRLFINTRATCKWVLLLSLFTNKAEAQRALSSGLGGGGPSGAEQQSHDGNPDVLPSLRVEPSQL